ncbi:lipoprotein LpqH [Gulosibacter sp. 10]|uniref:lipoprotein LpqH n=1 Tax=Gulosibacter sp. 10 TaxID=1255570 RepID=UPI00097F1696|nr:lipoprotein LpqH [Gulosibacter sp. 10]SJM60196.1 hypothetical protein FM112_06985 [Gulosibacter sp. 10]
MKHTTMKTLIAAVSTAALLTACSSTDPEETAPPETGQDEQTQEGVGQETPSQDADAPVETEPPAEEPPAEEDPSASDPAVSEALVTVDGEPMDLGEYVVECVHSSGFVVGVYATSPSAEYAVVLHSETGEGGLQALAFYDPEDNSLQWSEGMDGMAAPEVSVDGQTYTVSGEGIFFPVDGSEGTRNTPFEFQATCP